MDPDTSGLKDERRSIPWFPGLCHPDAERYPGQTGPERGPQVTPHTHLPQLQLNTTQDVSFSFPALFPPTLRLPSV